MKARAVAAALVADPSVQGARVVAYCERIEFGSTAVQINRDCPMWRRSDAAVGGDHAPKGRLDDEMTGVIEAKGRC